MRILAHRTRMKTLLTKNFPIAPTQVNAGNNSQNN